MRALTLGAALMQRVDPVTWRRTDDAKRQRFLRSEKGRVYLALTDIPQHLCFIAILTGRSKRDVATYLCQLTAQGLAKRVGTGLYVIGSSYCSKVKNSA